MARSWSDRDGIAVTSASDKRLVLVVHGIGDEKPGDAVDSLTRSIRATRQTPGADPPSPQEILWLPKKEGRRLLEQFPCRIERTRDDRVETVLAEVSWVDLSHVPRTLFGTLRGLFDLIFGLRHVARHAARPKSGQTRWRHWSAKCLEWLCTFVSCLLSGPVMAVTVTWLIGWALLVGIAKVGLVSEELNEPALGTLAALAAGFMSTLIGGLGWLRRRGGTWDNFFLWLLLTGPLAVLLFSIWYLQGYLQSFTFEPMFAFADMLRLTPTLVVIVALAVAWLAWLIASVFADEAERPRLALALATSILAAALLTLVINLVFVWAVQPYEILRERASEASVNIVERTEQPSGQPEEDRTTQESQSRPYFNDYLLPRMSVYWVIGFGLGLIFVVPLMKRRRWIRASAADDYDPSKPVPRLILSRWAVGYLIVMGIAVPMSTLIPADPFRVFFSYLAMGNTLFTGASILVVAAVASLWTEPLRQGIDLGRDIVARFEGDTAKGKNVFPVWEEIQDRFKKVLVNVLAREKPDRLSIVAHSQGTIVAIEVLSQPDAADLLSPLESCDLVTLGCPFDHLYQHYFASDYPPLDDAHWNNLKTRAPRWVNIFRVDDFVGTHIEPRGGWPNSPRVGAGAATWPENRPVSAAGHTGYWIDLEVAKILCDEDLV